MEKMQERAMQAVAAYAVRARGAESVAELSAHVLAYTDCDGCRRYALVVAAEAAWPEAEWTQTAQRAALLVDALENAEAVAAAEGAGLMFDVASLYVMPDGEGALLEYHFNAEVLA